MILFERRRAIKYKNLFSDGSKLFNTYGMSSHYTNGNMDSFKVVNILLLIISLVITPLYNLKQLTL
jgi:hypothetical protein